MTKIKKIEVKNFKAVSEQIADFNGCSAIITAGNEKGKTSLLRGLIDRIRGAKPDVILKEGEEKGYNIIELTDGSRIEWTFTQKGEYFAYISPEGLKQTQGVIKSIGQKYFGEKFDIDKFLNKGPKDQVKELQSLVGLDFEEIENRYKKAFEERKEANKELKRLQSMKLQKPEPVKKPDIESLKKKLEDTREKNRQLKEKWQKDNEKYLKEIEQFNKNQDEIGEEKGAAENALEYIETGLNDLWGFGFKGAEKVLTEAKEFVNNLPEPQEKKPYKNLPEPTYYNESQIEKEIEQANEQLRKYEAYKKDLENYNNWVEQGKKAKEHAEKCDQKVKEIEQEKKEKLKNAEIPKEFEIHENGLYYKGLPLTDNQISSSGKYIAALKLGSMVLGEIKTLAFDASTMDKNTLSEIQEWAKENDLQLLIERPDFDGGEIKYQII